MAARRGRDLHRILGITFGIAISLGSAIGSGILRTPSLIADLVPDGAFIVGIWVVGGLHAALGVNVYAELGTAFPKAGGGYVFVRRAFGDSVGLLVGWSDWLTSIATIAAGSVSFAEFSTLLWPAAAPHRPAIAIGLQALLYGANALGLRQGRLLQESTSLLKAGLLFVFIAVAVVIAPTGPAVAAAPMASPIVGFGALIISYQMVLGAYTGWQTPVTFSEENADPRRNIPRALILGLVMIAVLYVGVNAALLAVLGPRGLAGSPLPFILVVDRMGGHLPGLLFAAGAMIVVASCANASVMTGSRVLFALSRDGLMPAHLHLLNKGGSPEIAFLFCAVASMALAATGSFGMVFGLIGTLSMLIDVLVSAALFALRRQEPELARPFRAIFFPWLPGLLFVIDASLLIMFARSDRNGVLFAFALAAFCIPFALVARRARSWRRAADV
jgi:APA family basic amino acid/polyamine antiporter